MHVANCTVTEITSMLARDSESRHPFSAEPTREILPSPRESLLGHNFLLLPATAQLQPLPHQLSLH